LRLALRTDKHIGGIVLTTKAEWNSKHFDLNIGKLVLALFNPEVNVESRRCNWHMEIGLWLQTA
jgi:hypothetical protein